MEGENTFLCMRETVWRHRQLSTTLLANREYSSSGQLWDTFFMFACDWAPYVEKSGGLFMTNLERSKGVYGLSLYYKNICLW